MYRKKVVAIILFITAPFIGAGTVKAAEFGTKSLTTDTLKPFSIDYTHVSEQTIDVSFLLEKPAGKSGFITVKDGKMVKPDGTNMRLWGVNITDWTRGSVQIPEKEASSHYAAVLARLGINCVRLTFLDFFAPRGLIDPGGNDTRSLDTSQLDKLDFWIAELKKNGIYTDLNLLVGRTYKEGDEVMEYHKIGWAKYVSYFDPQLIKLQKEFARQLLTHYNPYTKTEYRNEPAVVLVELVNENTLFDAWHRDALHPADTVVRDVNFRNLTPYHADLLTALYNNYLKENIDRTTIHLIEKQAGVNPDEQIPRPRRQQYRQAGNEWFQTTVSFYTAVEKNYFKEMKKFLKDTLQVKPLLLGSNDFLHNQSEYPMVESNAVLDVLDGHVYWQHPSWPGKINTPMVNEPDSSTVIKLSRTAMAGKPYTVTEINNAFPNDYESEGIPITAAYGSFQDWSAVMLYTFEPKIAPGYKGYVGDAFDISHHPVKIPQMIAGALMYLRGDVKQALNSMERTYTKQQIAETMRMPVDDFSYYTPGYPEAYFFNHQVRIGSVNGPETNVLPLLSGSPYMSDTKELKWYPSDKGVVTINTPFSQGLIGFVRENEVSTSNFSADIHNEFCSMTISSLDNNPIDRAMKILLVAGAKVENTGQQWNASRTKAVRIGGAPSLIEVVKGNVTLKLKNASGVLIKPMDGTGKPFGEGTKAVSKGDVWTFPIGREPTTWYIIEVKYN